MGKSAFCARRQNSVFHSPIFSPRQQTTAPSYTLRAELGMTSFSSMPMTRPNPSHTGQAPTGELNANKLSEGSSNVIPSASKRVEKVCRMPDGTMRNIHCPFPS